jgi:hypothetical protein
MKRISKLLVPLLLVGVCIATPTSSFGATAAKGKHHAKKVEKRAVVSAEDVRQLKEMIQAQQAQINELKQQAAERDRANQQAVTDAQKAAAAAQEKAAVAATTAADTSTKVETVQSDVNGLKTSVNTAVATEQKNEKRVKDLENPTAIHYKGVKLTPGGYMQFATIWRAHNANSDTSDNYGQYPYANSPNYYMSEFRATGRASRLSLKAEGAAKNMKFTAYTEIDFLGSAGGNETQTNTFAPRLRLAFAKVDFPHGWSITGGQDWSFIDTNRKGINPLSVWLPTLIDNSYTPGFSYAREGTINVVKQFAPWGWFGFSLENPDTVSTGSCTSSQCSFTLGNIQGLANSNSTTTPNNGYTNATSSTGSITGNPSTNPMPDFVAKFAFEPGWGHFEIKAIGRRFRDRVYPNFFSSISVPNFVTTTSVGDVTGGRNITTEGGGIGVGAIMPVVKHKVDVVFQGLGGAGIGRFGTTSGPDVTFNPKGALVPVKGVIAVAGIEMHPTPRFDFDLYGGGDYYQRVQYFIPKGSTFFGETTTANAEAGYGYQGLNVSGCMKESAYTGTTTTLAGKCTAHTKTVWAIQPVFWYRIYQGPAGKVQFGASYAYVHKASWSGQNGSSAPTVPVSTTLLRPTTNNQIVMTSFRYYLP